MSLEVPAELTVAEKTPFTSVLVNRTSAQPFSELKIKTRQAVFSVINRPAAVPGLRWKHSISSAILAALVSVITMDDVLSTSSFGTYELAPVLAKVILVIPRLHSRSVVLKNSPVANDTFGNSPLGLQPRMPTNSTDIVKILHIHLRTYGGRSSRTLRRSQFIHVHDTTAGR